MDMHLIINKKKLLKQRENNQLMQKGRLSPPVKLVKPSPNNQDIKETVEDDNTSLSGFLIW